MKKRLALLAAGLLIMFSGKAFAAGLGYVDYQRVTDNYSVARAAVKEVDAKSLELQQYMIDKERQYKALNTPLEKQNFESTVARELKAKEEALAKLKVQKEEQVYTKIQTVAKQVMVEQKLDAIMHAGMIFAGGVDITDLVINKLKTTP